MRYEFVVDLKPVKQRPKREVVPAPPSVPPIRRALVLAHQVRDFMQAHKITTLADFAGRAHITTARATQIMKVLTLSSRIQESILMGEIGRLSGMTSDVVQEIAKEPIWDRQEQLFQRLTNPADEVG